jgi:pimeloyl-ACP methyl ester carboxylesterase
MMKVMGVLLAASLYGQSSFEGNWQGTLEAGPAKLRLAFHISRNSQGDYASTLDSVDQGATNIPISRTTVTGAVVHLEIASLRASYDGTLSADGTSIEGKFTQGTSLPLTLRRSTEASPRLNRPQTPKPPFPYLSEDVSYENKAAGVTLAGTLTMPREGGPFPAAILITGSGTHDRDETLFGHKPFLVIADYLTRRGIAVLRVDDRGAGKSTGAKSKSSFEDLAGDVLAGVDYLSTRKEINAKEIGVIGHSEGASVGPLAASRSDRIAFVVMLAGIGVTGEEVLLKQGEMVVRSQGLGDSAVAMQRRIQEPLLNIVKEEQDPQAAEAKLIAAIKKVAPQMPDQTARTQAQAVNSAEIRGIINFDAGPVLSKLKMPVLAMGGSRDIQVPPSQNLPAIEAALKKAGNRDFQVTELPGLNHLFQTCQKCTVAEYGELEETVSPAALKVLGDWLTAHVR